MAVVIRSTLIIATFVAALSITRSAQGAASDPFGTHAVEVTSSPLVEKWFATVNKLGRDHALVGTCIDNNVVGCAAARRLRDIIDDAKAQNGLAVIGHINSRHQF
jgi:hypothetical protein